MVAPNKSSATTLSYRVLQLSLAQLTAAQQGQLGKLERLLAERQKEIDTLGRMPMTDCDSQAVVSNLRQSQSADRDIEALLSAALQEMRREIEGIKVGRRLLQRYGDDQQHLVASTLDVHS